jgi:hypothetical protein
MILNKIFSFAASIIKLFILLLLTINSNAQENNSNSYSEDFGTLSINVPQDLMRQSIQKKG